MATPEKILHCHVSRADLVRELGLVQGAVERKATIPILSHAMLAASDGLLTIRATDLEVGIATQCSARVSRPGSIAVPAKKLHDYIRLLPDGDIEITATANQWLSVSAGKSKTRIAGMAADSFPDLPSTPSPVGSIAASSMARLIERVSFAISAEESRFTLQGARLETGEQWGMVATDGHRLAWTRAAGPSGDKREFAIVPRRAIAELHKLAKDGAQSQVDYASDDNSLYFQVGARLLVTRRLSGSFPDYERVLPKGYPGSAIVNRTELQRAISRVRGFADERSRSIRLTIEQASVALDSSLAESGECSELVDATVTGIEKLCAGVNADYIGDFLAAESCEAVEIRVKDSNSALEFRPVGDAAEAYRCIVMPMRI